MGKPATVRPLSVHLHAALADATTGGTHLGRDGSAMHDTPTFSDGPTELGSLRQRVALLESRVRWRGRMLGITTGALLALGVISALGGIDVRRQLASCRARLVESGQSHTALAAAGAGGERRRGWAPEQAGTTVTAVLAGDDESQDREAL
jgi:hypothetical protein